MKNYFFTLKQAKTALLIITFLSSQALLAQKQKADTIAGIFDFFSYTDRIKEKELIPQYICSGIFNKTHFVFRRVEPINNELSQNSYEIDPSLFDKLKSSQIHYFLHGSFSEYNDNFQIEFDLVDIKTQKKLITKYNSKYKPFSDFYKEIEAAAAYILKSVNAYKTKKIYPSKNIAFYYYKNIMDTTTSRIYEIGPEFPVQYLSQNLSGDQKFNIIPLEKSMRYINQKLSLAAILDSMNTDALITGEISKDTKSKKMIVQTKIYLREKNAEGHMVIDSILMPEIKENLFLSNEVQKKAFTDLQNFLEKAIDDSIKWDSGIINSTGLTIHSIINSIDIEIKNKEFGKASALAFVVTQKKDSAWIGYQKLGLIEVYKENYDAALDYFEKSIEANPKDVISIDYKALIYIEKKAYKEAIIELEKCLKVDSTYPELHHNMAYCYYFLKDKKILAEAKLAIKTDSDSANVYTLLGFYYKEIKNQEDSVIYYFTKALSIKDTSYNRLYLSEAYVKKGDTLLKQQLYRQSLSFFLLASKTNTANADAADKIRSSYTCLKMYDTVDVYIKYGIDKKLFKPETVYSTQAEDYRSMKNPSGSFNDTALRKALVYLDKLEQVTKPTSYIYKRKGSVYFRLNSLNASIENYQKAFKLDPYNIVNTFNMTEVMIIKGEDVRAAQMLNESLKMINENPYYSKSLGKDDKAVAYFLLTVIKIKAGQNFSQEQKKLEEIVGSVESSQVFITGWNFITFQKWLEKSTLSGNTKNQINEQLKFLSKYTDPLLMLPKL